MGLYGKSGLESAFQSVAALVANLVGQALNVASVHTSGGIVGTNSGTSDLGTRAAANTSLWLAAATPSISNYAINGDTSGNTIINGGTLSFAINNNIDWTVNASGTLAPAAGFALGLASKLAINTAPTVTAGAGASIVASNGSACFEINLGAAAQSGTITLPSATTGWVVSMYNITNPAANAPAQTGFTQTSATFTNFIRTTGVAGNWTANDHMVCIAMAY